MISQAFEYKAASNLADALKAVAAGAKPLAGGQSLIPMMKLRLAAPAELIDIGRLAELNYIKEEGGELKIGAATTHYQVESSAAIRAKCPLLAETAAAIGDIQVRNMGTIGGSIAHADPAADYPAALQALEAKVRIAGVGGERTVSIDEFLVDTFTTALADGEIIREIILPVEAGGTGTSYQKMLQPASGFAIVGVAARIAKSGDKITMARIGITGLSNRAFRARAVEQALQSGAEVDAAAAKAADGVDANADIHASAAYRKRMAAVYAARAIRAALARSA
jgi:carbon-monoxide dehydrogenase medium subunit